MTSTTDVANRTSTDSHRPLVARLAVLCDFASLTGEKLNLLGIFNELRPTTLPLQVIQMFVVVVYEAATVDVGTSKTVTLSLHDPHAERLISVDQAISLESISPLEPDALLTVNHVTGFGGLVFPTAGQYSFRAEVEGFEIAAIPLTVRPLQSAGDVK